ncbi:hypothetical protein Bbelb_202510 [Branchiostoma belcheri]|nr:hypothetical protein Bbelb_202510 [Branchiostoma belcheri]
MCLLDGPRRCLDMISTIFSTEQESINLSMQRTRALEGRFSGNLFTKSLTSLNVCVLIRYRGRDAMGEGASIREQDAHIDHMPQRKEPIPIRQAADLTPRLPPGRQPCDASLQTNWTACETVCLNPDLRITWDNWAFILIDGVTVSDRWEMMNSIDVTVQPHGAFYYILDAFTSYGHVFGAEFRVVSNVSCYRASPHSAISGRHLADDKPCRDKYPTLDRDVPT